MCHTIDLQKCFLCDLTTIFLPLCFLLRPMSFQNTEYDNIKSLIYVCGVCRVAEDVDLMGAGIVEELKGVMGIMAINNQ